MNSNICPNCHGTANHLITDIDGSNLYYCTTGLTSFDVDSGGDIVYTPYIRPCDTVVDSKGKLFTGSVAFITNKEIKTLSAREGKIAK